jgi:hypothetical protein
MMAERSVVSSDRLAAGRKVDAMAALKALQWADLMAEMLDPLMVERTDNLKE